MPLSDEVIYEKIGGGWAASSCTAVDDFVNTAFMVCSGMRLG